MGTATAPQPRMLGRYALYEQIAAGGMASVHIGRLVGPVGFARTVAIKRMHPQLASDPEFVSMFLDEARLAARIRHPNVVPTLDVVTTEGELFLVMDFVQGESLSRLIRSAVQRHARIRPEIVATIMVGVLHGLHSAHEAKSDRGEPLGVVHRDVSPHNVLVGVDGVSRVLDFGVAKAVGRLQTTREGQLKGKLAYMAPEQLQGKVTRATDVYAASVVLWEALTAKRLFHGDNEGHVFGQVMKGCQEPPSRFAQGIPAALDAVTMRGLQVDPADRFVTAREMALALEEAIALATTSKVGDWVEASAKETLDERSERISRIESDSATTAPSPEPSAWSDGKTEPDAGLAIPAPAIADDVIPTQLSSGSVSAPGRAPIAPQRSRLTWVVAGAAFLGVAVVAGIVGRSSAPGATTSAAPLTSSPVASSPPTPPRPASTTPSAPADWVVASATAPTAPSLPTPETRTVVPEVASEVAPEASAPTAPVAAEPVVPPPVVAQPVAATPPVVVAPALSPRVNAPAATPPTTKAATPCKLVKTIDKYDEPHFSCPCASCQ